MKRSSFKVILRSLLDAWISSPERPDRPVHIYDVVHGLLRPSMVLLIAELQTSNARDFEFDFVHRYRLPSLLFDEDDLARAFAPAIFDAIERGRPVIGQATKTVVDTHVFYDYAALPQKSTPGHSAWCIALLDIKLALPAATVSAALDDTDLAILQLLTEGASAKEISTAAKMSFRTIEHRIEKLKVRFGAKSAAHLVALSISAALSRRDD